MGHFICYILINRPSKFQTDRIDITRDIYCARARQIYPAVIQKYSAKMTKKWPKTPQIESNMAFMSPNALHHVLIIITLHEKVTVV
jgi:hypothetical protein